MEWNKESRDSSDEKEWWEMKRNRNMRIKVMEIIRYAFGFLEWMEWNMIRADRSEDKEWNKMKLNALKWNEMKRKTAEYECERRRGNKWMNEWNEVECNDNGIH